MLALISLPAHASSVFEEHSSQDTVGETRSSEWSLEPDDNSWPAFDTYRDEDTSSWIYYRSSYSEKYYDGLYYYLRRYSRICRFSSYENRGYCYWRPPQHH